MKFSKTIVFLLIFLILPCRIYALELTDNEKKQFRRDFLQINKNRFFDLNELEKKADNDIRYKILLWHQLANSKSPKTFNDIREFINENPEFPKKYLLVEQAEKKIPNEIEEDELEEWFEENPASTIDGVARYINFLDDDEINIYLVKFWVNADFTVSEDNQFYLKFKDNLDKEDVIKRINALLWKGKTKNATILLKYVPKDYQLLFKARIALRKRYRNITKTLAMVPKHLENDEGLVFERIKWRRRQNLYNEAIELLDSEYSHKTHPDKWWEERLIIVRQLLKQGKYQQAYDVTIKGDNTLKSIMAENQWLAGWIAYRFLNRPDIALGHFLSMREVVSSFISVARGDYWIARCYEEMHDLPRAWNYYNESAQYMTTFYGQKAAQKAEIVIDDVFENVPSVSDWQYNRYKKSELAQGIKFLSDLKLKGLMNSFIMRAFFEAREEDEEDVVSLVMFLREIGRKEMAVLITRRARTAGIDVGFAGYPVLKNIKYPKNADKALIHAVVRQESGFNPTAKSPAGARGLMQIMPATARNLSQWKRLRYSLKRLTSDINYNVTLGEYYLWRLLRQHKGSYIQSFAAYNAGAGNVRKWNRDFAKHEKYNDLDDIDWIESIPYDETRNYVQRVEENYFIYKKLFENESQD